MLKIKSVKTGLIGKKMPKDDATRGVFVHQHFEQEGWPMNHGRGADIPKYNIEVKSRRLNAVSPLTIGTVKFQDLLTVPYEKSLVAEKMQYQLRVTVDQDSIVTAVDVCDFTPEFIQDMIKKGYDQVKSNARQLKDQGLPKTIPGNKYCYAERTQNTDSYRMRLSPKGMNDLIQASKSTFDSIFIYNSK